MNPKVIQLQISNTKKWCIVGGKHKYRGKTKINHFTLFSSGEEEIQTDEEKECKLAARIAKHILQTSIIVNRLKYTRLGIDGSIPVEYNHLKGTFLEVLATDRSMAFCGLVFDVPNGDYPQECILKLLETSSLRCCPFSEMSLRPSKYQNYFPNNLCGKRNSILNAPWPKNVKEAINMIKLLLLKIEECPDVYSFLSGEIQILVHLICFINDCTKQLTTFLKQNLHTFAYELDSMTSASYSSIVAGAFKPSVYKSVITPPEKLKSPRKNSQEPTLKISKQTLYLWWEQTTSVIHQKVRTHTNTICECNDCESGKSSNYNPKQIMYLSKMSMMKCLLAFVYKFSFSNIYERFSNMNCNCDVLGYLVVAHTGCKMEIALPYCNLFREK